MTNTNINQLDKMKKDLIYNLEPDEFTKLINELFINRFKAIFYTDSTDINEIETKVNNYDNFIGDLLENMPDKLLWETRTAQKIDLTKSNTYEYEQLNQMNINNISLIGNYKKVFHVVTMFLMLNNQMNNLRLLIMSDLIYEDNKTKKQYKKYFDKLEKTSMFNKYNEIIEYIEKPEYQKLINHIDLLDNIVYEYIKNEIQNHKDFLEDFQEYKAIINNNGLI